jgi:hypothetical protein
MQAWTALLPAVARVFSDLVAADAASFERGGIKGHFFAHFFVWQFGHFFGFSTRGCQGTLHTAQVMVRIFITEA